MKSYITYRDEKRGIEAIAETVHTVEKIATSSVRVLQQKTLALYDYTHAIHQILTRLSLYYSGGEHALMRHHITGKRVLIILSGNRGLVGGLWHKLINSCLANRRDYRAFVVFGEKAQVFLEEEGVSILKAFTDLQTTPTKEGVQAVTEYLFDAYKQGEFSQVDVLYPHFISLAQQISQIVPLLPFQFTSNLPEESATSAEGFPVFEPTKKQNFNMLIQKYIEIFFYMLIVETRLSEVSARSVAMEQASDKTKLLMKKLSVDYTKMRHRTATQRQLESFSVHRAL